MIQLDLRPPDDVVRKFGFIASVGFPVMGVALTYWPASILPTGALWVFVGLAAYCTLASALGLIALVRPVFIGMTLIGWPIGFVVSTVLLSLIYFLMFTPLGLLFRLLGRDPMRRKLHGKAESYWITRENQRKPASYLRIY